MRSGSFAPMCWPNVIATGSLATGALQVFATAGSAAPPIVSGDGRANVPLIRCPGWFALRSATVSIASPAVEVTWAVVAAV